MKKDEQTGKPTKKKKIKKYKAPMPTVPGYQLGAISSLVDLVELAERQTVAYERAAAALEDIRTYLIRPHLRPRGTQMRTPKGKQ